MRHIPNILSGFRIVLIPFFIWQFLSGNTTTAGVILLLSGFTDLLDGYLARRFHWVSQIGKVLDPVADKMTQITVCVLCIYKMRSLWPFFLILLLKDCVMLILGGFLMAKGIKLEGARWFGKVSTALFYGTAICLVFFPQIPLGLTYSLLTLTVVCALVAALLYIPEFKRYRRAQNIEENHADKKVV